MPGKFLWIYSGSGEIHCIFKTTHIFSIIVELEERWATLHLCLNHCGRSQLGWQYKARCSRIYADREFLQYRCSECLCEFNILRPSFLGCEGAMLHCAAVLCSVMQCGVVQCSAVPCCPVLCCAVLPSVPCRATLCFTGLGWAGLGYAVLCSAVQCSAVQCCAVLHCTFFYMLWFLCLVMLCLDVHLPSTPSHQTPQTTLRCHIFRTLIALTYRSSPQHNLGQDSGPWNWETE